MRSQSKIAPGPRPPRTSLVAAVLVAAAGLSCGQETWSLPAEITVRVDCFLSMIPIEGFEITLRTFAGPLGRPERRRAAFSPPVRSTHANSYGTAHFKLPLWSMVIDRPLAVVCRGSGDMIYPFNRESYRPRVCPVGRDEVIRFVDSGGQPASGARVALLIGVHQPSCVRAATWGPRYENLVVASVATTSSDGSAAAPAGTVVALVDRGTDIVPVIVDGKRIVVPESFEAAKRDERLSTALTETEREPPDESASERAVSERFSGKGEVEGKVIVGGYDDTEVIAVPYTARLDIVAAHRIPISRPRLPFARTSRGDEHRFQVAYLPSGTYRLQVAAPHFAPRLSRPFEIRGDRKVRLDPIELERGAVLLVKGTMGCATFDGCSKCFDGPNGVIDGLGRGRLTVSSWNGGCCGGPSKEVHIPRSGEVIVDLSDSQR